jgi:DNA-binding transcriptional ArsR family regulator
MHTETDSPLLDPATVAQVARQFRALSEPSRWRLLHALAGGECTVGEIAERTQLSIANVSKHLGVLHDACWVTRRRDGLHVRYGLADERALALWDVALQRLAEFPMQPLVAHTRRR